MNGSSIYYLEGQDPASIYPDAPPPADDIHYATLLTRKLSFLPHPSIGVVMHAVMEYEALFRYFPGRFEYTLRPDIRCFDLVFQLDIAKKNKPRALIPKQLKMTFDEYGRVRFLTKNISDKSLSWCMHQIMELMMLMFAELRMLGAGERILGISSLA